MSRFLSSELLFYGGITIMGAAVVAVFLCMIVFHLTGRKLKQQLEQEYGKPLQ